MEVAWGCGWLASKPALFLRNWAEACPSPSVSKESKTCSFLGDRLVTSWTIDWQTRNARWPRLINNRHSTSVTFAQNFLWTVSVSEAWSELMGNRTWAWQKEVHARQWNHRHWHWSCLQRQEWVTCDHGLDWWSACCELKDWTHSTVMLRCCQEKENVLLVTPIQYVSQGTGTAKKRF